MAKGETAKSRRKVRGQITAAKGETGESRRKEKKFENILQKCV